MTTKIVTYQDGMLHILRNPVGFREETVREAALAAADRIEALEAAAGRSLATTTPTPLTIDVDKDCQRYRWMKANMGLQPMFPRPGEAKPQVLVKLPTYDRRDGRLEWFLPDAGQLDTAIDAHCGNAESTQPCSRCGLWDAHAKGCPKAPHSQFPQPKETK